MTLIVSAVCYNISSNIRHTKLTGHNGTLSQSIYAISTQQNTNKDVRTSSCRQPRLFTVRAVWCLTEN